MKYRWPFFSIGALLLVQVTFFTVDTMRRHAELYAMMGGLFCPNSITGAPIFVLLVAVNLILIALYFQPKNDFLWWLYLVGLMSISSGVFTDLNVYHLLMALCIIFGLGYRRQLGLKHIWHWKGMVAIGAGVLMGWIAVGLGLHFLAEFI